MSAFLILVNVYVQYILENDVEMNKRLIYFLVVLLQITSFAEV